MAKDNDPTSVVPTIKRHVPKSVLIVGAGVFGLSTFSHLLTLPRYTQTCITLLDTHLPSLENPTDLPTQNPYAASIDSSRIVRPDYANASYARLAIAAQEKWRKGYGNCLSCGRNDSIYNGIQGTGEILKCEDRTCEHEPVYREPGLVITGSGSGTEYLQKARKNAEDLGLKIRVLEGHEEIAALLEGPGKPSRTDIEGWVEGRQDKALPGKNTPRNMKTGSEAATRLKSNDRVSALGETGYINYSSGWVNNGQAMANVMAQTVALARNRNRQPGKGRVTFKRGKAAHLIFSSDTNDPSKVTGVALANDSDVQADLTLLATGAHTASLVDLHGRAEARGQAMAYIALTPSEARSLRDIPVLLNMDTGMFAIPPVLVSLPQPPNTNNSSSPQKQWVLKIAQHAYGYINPTPQTLTTSSTTQKQTTPSLPSPQYTPIPRPSSSSLRSFLHSLPLPPGIITRPFLSTRLCWYTDTPTGDFLIDHHPLHKGLFLATGGSGHGFKFLPVLGEKIVEGVEGRLAGGLGELWRWREGDGRVFEGTEDGSRGGERGMVLGGGADVVEKAKL